MEIHVARPAGQVAGGIILFQDAYGVNEQLREIGARFADLGYLAVAPELFHRTGDGIVAAYDDNRNPLRMQAKDELTLDGMAADAKTAYDHLVAEGIARDNVLAIGFCMGGRAAFLANAHLPLKAVISFYGGGIAPDLLDLAPRQHGPLLMFWGGKDTHIPAEERRAVEDALTRAGKQHVHVAFSRAKHAYFGHRHPDYDPDAARASWALLRESLC